MKKIASILVLIATLSLVVGIFFAWNFINKPLAIDEGGYLFELKTGESLGHLAIKLHQDKVISSINLFKLYGRMTRSTTHLKAGEYVLNEGDTLPDLFERLKKGSTVLRSITFVEGWSYRELFKALDVETHLQWEANEEALKQRLTLMNDHFEGMFFADTYFFSKGQNANILLEQSNRILLKVLEEEWQAREAGLPFKNSYEALILASIVEKETGLTSERPLIAGVFVNRLRKKMRLQTDPTVIYGLGETYQGNITRQHLQSYTPYNTYRISGLPPTPIAIVGKESIRAVMHPQKTDFLYFVAKGDGSHYFSSTLAEHEAAVRQYQHKRVTNYRSSPQQSQ